MVKFLKQVLKRAVGSQEEFSFEERLVIAYVLYGGITCFLSTLLNIWMDQGVGVVILMAFSTIFLGFVYTLGRIRRKIFAAKLLLSIYTLFFCNINWFLSYGSKGAATYIFLVYFFIMIFAWDLFQIRVIALFVVINILILFGIEISFPNLIPSYPSELIRIIDTYITLVILLGFFAIIIINVKSNYIKQYKKAQKSDKLKSAFLANISHEIRTPLNAIIGFSQLLSERELSNDKKEKYSHIITENGDYLMKLVSDILDISMIESGHIKIVNSNVNLNNVFKQLYSIQKEIIQNNFNSNIDLILELPESTIFIELDEMRLKQVLYNLIDNAIKYTSKGFIKFGFKQCPNEILFFVEDSGCGIKEEFQPQIFERFVRNEETLEVKATRGSGIGLSLSKDLVNILGGKIWFTSEYKKGSTFYFSLPSNVSLSVEN